MNYWSRALVLVLVTLSLGFSASSALAAVDSNLPTKMVGYGWAPNWGWLNFGQGGAGYPNIATTTDTTGTKILMAGYVWSTNLGWLRLGPDLTGPGTGAEYHQVWATKSGSTYAVTGWLRACSVYVNSNLCSGAVKTVEATERGGWDGWFKLKDVVYSTTTKKYSGFAWGDLVGGWVNFAAVAGDNGAIEIPTTFSAACNGAPLQTAVGGTVTWQAGVTKADSQGPYTYAWYENVPPATTPTSLEDTNVSNSLSDTSTKTYSAAGTYYRRLVVTDNSPVKKTATANCSVSAQALPPGTCTGSSCGGGGGGGGGGGVTVTDNTKCYVQVKYNNAAVSDKLDSQLVAIGSVSFDTDNQTTEFACGQKITLTATVNDLPVGVNWSTGCTATAKPTCTAATVLTPGTRIVNAVFPGVDTGAQLSLLGGDGTGNIVNVINPSSYPTKSTSRTIAKISLVGGSGEDPITVAWGGLDAAAAKIFGCEVKLCLDSDSNCTSSASPALLTVTSVAQKIYFLFPSKCVDPATRYSVFHQPVGYWSVTLSGQASRTNKTLLLKFNDQTPSPL